MLRETPNSVVKEDTGESGPQLIVPLHGLRGLAALAVLVGHVDPLRDIFGIRLGATIGVLLFFSLSGFLMGHLYLTSRPTPSAVWRYCVARFARVYPLFAFTILLAAGLDALWGISPFGMPAEDIAAHLFLAGQAFTVWTISVEFQFYGFFILLWLVHGALGQRAQSVFFWPVVLCLSVLALLVLAPEGRIDLLRYIHLFLWGAFAAVVLKHMKPMLERWSGIGQIIGLSTLAAAFLVIEAIYPQDLVYRDFVLCIAAVSVVLFACAGPAKPAARLLSHPLLVWLGEISFGVYLFHRIAMAIFDLTPLAAAPRFIELLFVLPVTLLASVLANIVIEKPCRNAIRSFALNGVVVFRRPVVK